MEGKKRKLKWKQVLTPETLELLSGIGTKPLKIIAATVYEWERETDRDNEVRRQKMKGGGGGPGRCREHWETHADKRRGTHLQETAAKSFAHGENKQETNQLQKLMSAEKTLKKQESGISFMS